jgi:PDZ domain/Aspartyl protease
LITKSFISFLLGAVLPISVPFAAAAQGGSCPAIAAPAAEVPLTLIGDHIYIEAMVNGTGPYRFIIDTGGVNLIDTGLARQLSLTITGSEAGHGTGPETVESGKTTIERLTLGNITFTGQPFYTFDFGQLYAGGGVKMMGMLGAMLFHQYVTCIDFDHKEVELIESAKFNARRAGSSLTMSIKASEITVRGSFDGIPGVFQIDTGSPTTLTLAAPFVAQHQLLKRFPRRIETSSGGVGGSMREDIVRGRDLILGTEQIEHPIVALASVSKGKLAQSSFSGIIGMGALKRYIVTFDFPGQRLFLNPYKPVPANLDTYDRSGMRIETMLAGFRVVSVAAGTPAAEAGLEPGDVIIAIDGRPASSVTLPGLRDELRQLPPGSVITLAIRADGEPRNVRIILRDLI